MVDLVWAPDLGRIHSWVCRSPKGGEGNRKTNEGVTQSNCGAGTWINTFYEKSNVGLAVGKFKELREKNEWKKKNNHGHWKRYIKGCDALEATRKRCGFNSGAGELG